MKVLLLQTRRRTGLGLVRFIVTEPLGLEVVAASLKGHQVRILDLFDDRELAAEVEDFTAHAVGIGCSFTNKGFAREFSFADQHRCLFFCHA